MKTEMSGLVFEEIPVNPRVPVAKLLLREVPSIK